MTDRGIPLTLVAVQTEPVFGDIGRNLDAIDAALEGVTADVVVLPELCSTGYSFRDRAEARALAEPFPAGPTARRLVEASRRTGGFVVGGFAEREGERLYNAAIIAAAGRVLGCYRKLHLFGFEGECFDSGDRPLTVYEHEGLRVGVMICFDWMFPEAARTLALAGADVVAHPSNLVLPGWCQRAMCIRALENHVYTVTANRVGTEHRAPRPPLHFTGVSRIASPLGEVLADGADDRPCVVRTEGDVRVARRKSIRSGNDVIADRRPSFYAGWSAPSP